MQCCIDRVCGNRSVNLHLLELHDVRVPEHAVDEDLPLDVAPVGLYEQVTDEPASEAAAAPRRRPQQRLGFALVSRFNTTSSSQRTDGSELEQHHDAGGFEAGSGEWKIPLHLGTPLHQLDGHQFARGLMPHELHEAKGSSPQILHLLVKLAPSGRTQPLVTTRIACARHMTQTQCCLPKH